MPLCRKATSTSSTPRARGSFGPPQSTSFWPPPNMEGERGARGASGGREGARGADRAERRARGGERGVRGGREEARGGERGREVSTLLLYLNFPPARVPPNNGLHSTSLFKLCPPCVPPNNGLHYTSSFKLSPPLRSTKQWSPFYFFILHLNFPPLLSTKQWSPFYFFI